MTIFQAVLALVLLQRGGELILAHANTVRLLRLGAVEVDRGGYKWFVVLHAAWLVALALTVPAATSPHWPLLALFFLLQAGRVWVIASLGRRWTTRLIVRPGAELVTSGPYRLFCHPNYLIVVGELASWRVYHLHSTRLRLPSGFRSAMRLCFCGGSASNVRRWIFPAVKPC